MKRITHPARPSWKARVERELGFTFHSPGGLPYWDETAHFEFTADQVDYLDEVGVELYKILLEACDHVVANQLFGKLGIPEAVAPAVEWSWNRFRSGKGEFPVYGRFDIAWDGKLPSEGGKGAKMLEYNASTPTSLYEASVVQYKWLEEYAGDKDQFNGLHETLVERWRFIASQLPHGTLVHFVAQQTPEDMGTIAYMSQIAHEAGLRVKCMPIQDVGYDEGRGCFVDPSFTRIDVLWSLYPPEWLIQDRDGARLMKAIMEGGIILMEPLWKLMLTKGILAIAWEMYEFHPNLLKTSFKRTDFRPGDKVAAKPLWGREGDGVELVTLGDDLLPVGKVVKADRERFAGQEGWIYQAATELPDFGGGHTLLGIWMIGHETKGMGIREDRHAITGDTSRFVPHLFHPHKE